MSFWEVIEEQLENTWWRSTSSWMWAWKRSRLEKRLREPFVSWWRFISLWIQNENSWTRKRCKKESWVRFAKPFSREYTAAQKEQNKCNYKWEQLGNRLNNCFKEGDLEINSDKCTGIAQKKIPYHLVFEQILEATWVNKRCDDEIYAKVPGGYLQVIALRMLFSRKPCPAEYSRYRRVEEKAVIILWTTVRGEGWLVTEISESQEKNNELGRLRE